MSLANSTPVQVEWITCGMCGHRFDPSAHGACGQCPLAPGCQLVCCPVCGFETVNPQRSALVQTTRKASEILRGWMSRMKS